MGIVPAISEHSLNFQSFQRVGRLSTPLIINPYLLQLVRVDSGVNSEACPLSRLFLGRETPLSSPPSTIPPCLVNSESSFTAQSSITSSGKPPFTFQPQGQFLCYMLSNCSLAFRAIVSFPLYTQRQDRVIPIHLPRSTAPRQQGPCLSSSGHAGMVADPQRPLSQYFPMDESRTQSGRQSTLQSRLLGGRKGTD